MAELRDNTPSGDMLGLLGNGQLGLFFLQSAHRSGFQVAVRAPGVECPCRELADAHFSGNWDDVACTEDFLNRVETVTTELEQVPADVLDSVAASRELRPSADVVKICQHRANEKNWLLRHGFPLAPFRIVSGKEDLDDALRDVPPPCVLKSADGGYDGKGQVKINSTSQAGAAWDAISASQAVLEGWIEHEKELSVVCARDDLGHTRCFPACENIHAKHILAMTIFPARISDELATRAQALASQVAQSLRVHGLVTVEFFLTRSGELLVNELAPRPHNSGHITMDACDQSQFDMQLLTTIGEALPQITTHSSGIMGNLLGNLWSAGVPDFSGLESSPDTKIYFYGKDDPRPGRKMGHFTVLGDDVDALAEKFLPLATSQDPALLP